MRDRFNRLPASSLLVSGDVRPFHPELAAIIGLNEAIALQQLYYWLERTDNERDGRYWVYNTYQDWQDQMPWMSIATVRRTFAALEQQGLVLTASFNRSAMDHTRWYTIDFEALDALMETVRASQQRRAEAAATRHASRSAQNEQIVESKRPIGRSAHSEQISDSDCTDGLLNLSSAVPETTSKTSQSVDARTEPKRDETGTEAEAPEPPPAAGPRHQARVRPRPLQAPAGTAPLTIPVTLPLPDRSPASPRGAEAPGPAIDVPVPPTPPSRYTATLGDTLPYLALMDLCRAPYDGQAVQDPRTSFWWRYEGESRQGVWRRMPLAWHPASEQ